METERILLRPWRDDDAASLFKYASDPEVGPRAGWPPHKSVEESLEIIHTVFHNDTNWAIELKATGEAIGAIGYWVGKPYWNQGICTEALELMLDHIRKITDIKSLISSHYFDNPASGKVMEKCGFKPTGESCIDEKLTGTTKPTRVMRWERHT